MGFKRGREKPYWGASWNPQPKESPKIQRKLTYIAKIRVAHDRARVHGRPCVDAQSHARPYVWSCAKHGLQHGRADGRATFLGLQHGRASPMHGRASFRSRPFALQRLRLTSILPSIPCESYIYSQNSKVIPKSVDKPQYQHIWIKGSDLSFLMWI